MAPNLGFKAQTLIDQGRTTQDNIDKMREWLSTQYYPNFTDEQIAIFLLASDNNHEVCKETLKAYYRVKMEMKDLFVNRNIQKPEMQQQIKTVNFAVFPEKTDDGCVIFYHKQNDPKARNFNYDLNIQLVLMQVDAVLHDDPPKGAIYVYDVEGTSVWHLSKTKWKTMKSVMYFIQEAVPLQVKEIHILNMAPYMTGFFNLLNKFLKQELSRKINFYSAKSKLEDFYKKIPMTCLPIEYGGDLPSVIEMNEKMLDKFKELKPYFDAEEEQWTDYYKNPVPSGD